VGRRVEQLVVCVGVRKCASAAIDLIDFATAKSIKSIAALGDGARPISLPAVKHVTAAIDTRHDGLALKQSRLTCLAASFSTDPLIASLPSTAETVSAR